MSDPLNTPTVSVVNLKGGVGKTATAVNLAFALAEWHDKSVLVVDIDPQFNATQHFLDEQIIVDELQGKTIKEILDPPPLPIEVGKRSAKKRIDPVTFIRKLQVEGKGSISILPSRLDLSFVTRNPAGKEGRLEQFLHRVDDLFDIILIDCPPTISVLSIAAFNASRYYLIPVTPDYFAPIGIPLIEEEVAYYLESLHSETGQMTPLGILFTIVDVRWHADWEQVAQRIEKATTITPFKTFFTHSKYWRDCAFDHEPVYRKHPNSPQATQLREFTGEFLDRLEAEEDK